jgi:hypothetical protein
MDGKIALEEHYSHPYRQPRSRAHDSPRRAACSCGQFQLTIEHFEIFSRRPAEGQEVRQSPGRHHTTKTKRACHEGIEADPLSRPGLLEQRLTLQFVPVSERMPRRLMIFTPRPAPQEIK